MFQPKSVPRKDIPGKWSGAAAFVNCDEICEVVRRAWRFDEKLVKEADIFFYMFRRFGTPTSGCDSYKSAAYWILTTPMDGMYLTVYPFGGSGFGYISNIPDFEYKIWEEKRKPINEYDNRFKAWAKETHGFLVYSPHYFERFGLKVEHLEDGTYNFIDPLWDLVNAEYDQWVISNNLPNLEADENANIDRFFTEFAEYQNGRIESYLKLYEAVEKRPEEAISETANIALSAITETAVSLMAYTNVRDCYYNVFGCQTKEMDTRLTAMFGFFKTDDGEDAPDIYVDYANPNDFIETYERGLACESESAEATKCGIDIGIVRGVALSVNYMLRRETAGSIWQQAGMTIRDCIAHGVANFDLERLIPAYATSDDAEAIAEYHIKNFPVEDIKHTDAIDFLKSIAEITTALDASKAALSAEPDGDTPNKDMLNMIVFSNESSIKDEKEVYIENVKETYNP